MSIEAAKLKSALDQFTGTKNWYRHALSSAILRRDITYTDGVKYLAEKAGAYWLIDLIFSVYACEENVRKEEFLLWTLTVNENKSAIVTCDNGSGTVLYTQEIEYSDFPLEEIKLYLTDGVLLLTKEY